MTELYAALAAAFSVATWTWIFMVQRDVRVWLSWRARERERTGTNG